MNKAQSFWFILILSLAIVVPLEGQINVFQFSQTNFSGTVGSGARAFGMGGAFIAVCDDATSASWNPAGLGQLEEPELSFVFKFQNYSIVNPASHGYQLIKGSEFFTGDASGFDFFSFTYPIRLGKIKLVPQISFQRSINFNLESKLKPSLTQVTNSLLGSTHFLLQEGKQLFQGGFDTLSFSLGATLFDFINLGISANLWTNGYKGDSKYNVQLITTDQTTANLQNNEKIDISVKGFNINAGILFHINDRLKIGAVFKNDFHLDMSLDYESEYDFYTETLEIVRENEIDHQDLILEWPATFGLGIAYNPIDPLTISMDLTKTYWSKSIIKNMDLFDTVGDVYFPSFNNVNSTEVAARQRDSEQFRIGMEYAFFLGKTIFPVRLGYFLDTQYYSDAAGEKIHLFGITAGIGIKRNKFAIDLAIVIESGKYMRTANDFSSTHFNELKLLFSTIYFL